jgi:hypothetical protein
LVGRWPERGGISSPRGSAVHQARFGGDSWRITVVGPGGRLATSTDRHCRRSVDVRSRGGEHRIVTLLRPITGATLAGGTGRLFRRIATHRPASELSSPTPPEGLPRCAPPTRVDRCGLPGGPSPGRLDPEEASDRSAASALLGGIAQVTVGTPRRSSARDCDPCICSAGRCDPTGQPPARRDVIRPWARPRSCFPRPDDLFDRIWCIEGAWRSCPRPTALRSKPEDGSRERLRKVAVGMGSAGFEPAVFAV